MTLGGNQMRSRVDHGVLRALRPASPTPYEPGYRCPNQCDDGIFTVGVKNPLSVKDKK